MEATGKILFKRTDIRTMKKDIKMLRELDLRKEQLKSLEPIAKNAPVEAQKQRVFALKSETEKAESQLKSLNAQQKAPVKQEKINETTLPANENAQRQKFMEDIESWANSSEKK